MRKVLELNDNGKHFVCYVDSDSYNRYRLYKKYYADCGAGYTWHRKLIEKYADINSVLYHIATETAQ